MPPSSSPPLAGLKVLDLSRVLAGPYCTQHLADLGAQVVKVEPPGGDDTRRFGPPFVGGESTYYLSVNRGKRSIVIDLKREEGQEVAHRLAAWADVAVANFRPGVDTKLGVDPETLMGLNPALVYTRISGFGQRGDPQSAALPGYDLVVQGMGGIPSVTGPADGSPHKVGTSIADLTAGLNAFAGTLAALYAREQSGAGRLVDVSMFDGQLSLLSYHASSWLNAGREPSRLGNAHPNVCPYETFRAADGHFNIGCGNDAQFRKLCALLNIDASADPRFQTNDGRVTHRAELLAILEPIVARESVQSWVQRLTDAGIPTGPIATVPHALDHPQTQARGMVVERPHATVGTLKTVGCPAGFEEASYAELPPPRQGEHTREVLKEVLGYPTAHIDALLSSGVIAALDAPEAL